jgi:hypothetical protein
MSSYEADFRKFMKLVADMRTAQQEYFKRIGKAKRTRQSDDFSLARNTLALSKDLEAQVDREIQKGIKAPELW